MDGLAWCTSYGTHGERLGGFLCDAVITLRARPLDDRDLPLEAGSAALDERHVSRQTHLVDVAPRLEVVERIEDNVEGFEEVDVELRIFYVGMMRLQLDVWVEFAGRLLRDL